MNLGFVTVLIAHITFNIPYVILNVLPKLKQTNNYTYEAAPLQYVAAVAFRCV